MGPMAFSGSRNFLRTYLSALLKGYTQITKRAIGAYREVRKRKSHETTQRGITSVSRCSSG